MAEKDQFVALVKHSLKFRLFLWTKLPMAILAGLKVESIAPVQAAVSVPYKYLTKNPFQSIYFACLAMAAELSTGLLAMMYLYKKKPPVSMLVTGMNALFLKKVTGKIIFTCKDGNRFSAAIEQAISSDEPQQVTAVSRGINNEGEEVAQFEITWSFKKK